MSSVSTPSRRPPLANFLSGLFGGLAVLVVGLILLATGVIDTGKDKTVVRETTITRPASDIKTGGKTVQEIYKKEGPGVVFIEAKGVSNDSPFGLPGQSQTATGSGFVLNKDGYILTNDHVVEGSQDVTVRLTEKGDPIDAQVKGRDPSTDVALLKVDADKSKLDPLPLGDSSKAHVGDPAVAIGNPFGLGRTVTTGIVSGVQRRIDAPNGFTITGALQTDASINPGNSGGPLLDANGKVIGINSQIATGGGQGSVGIGFAVPVNTVKKVVPKLKEKGKIEHPFIGVTTTPITPQLARDLNLAVRRGALVIDVRKGSPADKAGLRAGRTETTEGLRIGGDVIVKVDGRNVKNPDDVLTAINDNKPGDKVKIEYYRGGKGKTAEVTLANRPSGGNQSSQGQQNPLIP
jgi:S1-C subfamily serine protease